MTHLPGKNLTLYVPDDVAEKMEKLPEVNWSEVARKAILDYVQLRSGSVPVAIVERLRSEKEEEYAAGKVSAVREILSKIPFAELDRFFTDLHDKTNQLVEGDAFEMGVDPGNLNRNPYEEKAVKPMIESWFKLKGSSSFMKGVAAALKEAYDASKK
jgi:hypothetical protein